MLNLDQRRQLFRMREQNKDRILAAKSAQSCSMDIAVDLAWSTPLPVLFDTQATVNFLDISTSLSSLPPSPLHTYFGYPAKLHWSVFIFKQTCAAATTV